MDTTHEIDLTKLAFEAEARDRDGAVIEESWIFSGPGAMRFRIHVTDVKAQKGHEPARAAHLCMQTSSVVRPSAYQWPWLRSDFDAPVCSAIIMVSEWPECSGRELAIALRDRLANLFRPAERRTVRGTPDQMMQILQDAADLAETFVNIETGKTPGDMPTVTTEGDAVAGAAMRAIVDWFHPYGSAPPTDQAAKRRRPARLPIIQPRPADSGHDRLEQADRLRTFFIAHIDELDLEPRVRKGLHRAFKLD